MRDHLCRREAARAILNWPKLLIGKAEKKPANAARARAKPHEGSQRETPKKRHGIHKKKARRTGAVQTIA